MGFYRCVPTQSGGGTPLSEITDSAAIVEYGTRVTPATANNCANMFRANVTFNQPVVIGSDVTLCSYMFSSASNFNQPVIIGQNVTDCVGMFNYAMAFNQPLIIPDKVTSCASMFNFAQGFNQPVIIGSSVSNCLAMFWHAIKFNQPVMIPKSVTSCASMFSDIWEYNQSITIPSGVTNCRRMFNNCKNFGGDGKAIYINVSPSQTTHDFIGLLRAKNNSLRMNIFCSDLSLLTGTASANSIVNAAISWTATTNGYYNAVYNIYLYNNYSGTL